MNGEVGKLPNASRCDAILCPPLTWNDQGKAVSDSNSTCLPCPENTEFYGHVMCGVAANKEKEILDKLFIETGGPYWNKTHDNWMKPGVPICSREGVICRAGSTDSGVDELRLQNVGMQGEIPSEIWQLPYIRSLGFTNNAVDISFSGIEQATTLRVLKLSNCQLRDLEGLQNAPSSLSEIHLAQNQLDGTIPSEIFLLEHVAKIFLNNNNFGGRLSPDVGKMKAMVEMWLWDNQLTGVLPSEIGLMTALQRFDVSMNSMSGAIPSELERLINLRKLNLGGQTGKGNFEGPLPAFADSPFLTDVDFSGNSFSGWLPPSFLAKVDPGSQITADLSMNQFEGPIPEAWSRFESLNVDLSGNMISEIPQDLCNNNGWNNELVGLLGTCDAILCKPGSYLPQGRQTEVTQPCITCPDGEASAPFFGSRSCLDPKLRAERQILTDFYQATNGTNWLIQINWLSEYPTCSWYGVTCNDNGFVQELSLANNHLTSTGDGSGAIPLIFSLSGLTVRIKSES